MSVCLHSGLITSHGSYASILTSASMRAGYVFFPHSVLYYRGQKDQSARSKCILYSLHWLEQPALFP